MFPCRLHSIFLVLAVLSSLCARDVAAPKVVEVVGVHPTRIADLIVLGDGFDAGLRQGMVCRITRGASDIAEIILVDLRANCGSALIVSLSPGQSIRPGDVASVKVLKT